METLEFTEQSYNLTVIPQRLHICVDRGSGVQTNAIDLEFVHHRMSLAAILCSVAVLCMISHSKENYN